MVSKIGRKSGPGLDLRHSFTRIHSPGIIRPALFAKDETPHLVAQVLYFFWIRCCAKALRQCEKCFLFFLLRFQALLDQFDQHAIVAKASLLGDTLDLLGQPRG